MLSRSRVNRWSESAEGTDPTQPAVGRLPPGQNGSGHPRGVTRKAGTWPPPEVTLARPVALRRVRKPDSLPRNGCGAKSTSMSLNSTPPRRCDPGEDFAADGYAFLHDPAAGVAASADGGNRFFHRGVPLSCSLVSHPRVAPVPPYSSLGLSTRFSLLLANKDEQFDGLPVV